MEIAPEPATIVPVIVKLPVRLTGLLLVFNASVPAETAKFPAIDNVPDAGVFVLAPEKVRF